MRKVLMATPVHSSKDYATGRWLEAIGKFHHPEVVEFFLVDNSPDLEYVKYLIPLLPTHIRSTVVHVDIPFTDPEERVATAREEIRKKVMEEHFDWWFSWEQDTIAPPEILEKLLLFTDQFPVIHHLTPSRQSPDDDQSNSFGLSLIRADILEKFPFYQQWGNIDPLMPDTHHGADSWFNRRVLRAGYPIVELSGFVRPIQHLSQ